MNQVSADAPVIVDATAAQLFEYTESDRERFDSESHAMADELAREFAGNLAERTEGQEAAEAVERQLERLEEAIASVAGRRSRFFWMHLARRVPANPLSNTSDWTARLCRAVFELSLLKHGNPEAEDMSSGESFIAPSRLTFEDARDIFCLYHLAYQHNRAATAFRRIGRGAVLVANDDDFDAVADDDLERRMQLVDDRVDYYQRPFSTSGTALSLRNQVSSEAEKSPYQLLVPILNTAEKPLSPGQMEVLRLPSLPAHAAPNYMLGWIELEPLRRYLEMFAPQIEASFGADPNRLLTFLWAVNGCQMFWVHTKPGHGWQILQRGYSVTTGSDRGEAIAFLAGLYARGLERYSGIELDSEAALAEVLQLVDLLTYKESDYGAISLWNRTPLKPILVHGDFTIWDHAAIPMFLETLAASIGLLDGEPGNEKSAEFERQVKELIRATEVVEAWRTGKLRNTEGEHEVDASFSVNGALYIVECKAFSANPRYARGDWAALKSRWERLDSYLAKAKEVAEFFDRNRVGYNYEVPDVVRIEYCVSTPIAEYIPTDDPEYWFDRETPRICTPQELLEYATKTKRRLPTEKW